jgi:hypothetical protein
MNMTRKFRKRRPSPTDPGVASDGDGGRGLAPLGPGDPPREEQVVTDVIKLIRSPRFKAAVHSAAHRVSSRLSLVP